MCFLGSHCSMFPSCVMVVSIFLHSTLLLCGCLCFHAIFGCSHNPRTFDYATRLRDSCISVQSFEAATFTVLGGICVFPNCSFLEATAITVQFIMLLKLCGIRVRRIPSLQASTVTIFILMLLLCGIRVCRIPSPETATITISRGICVFPNCKLDTHRTSSCSLCSKYAVYPTPAVPRLCSLCSKYAVHPTPAVPRLCSLSSKYAVHPTPAVPRLCSLCSKYK